MQDFITNILLYNMFHVKQLIVFSTCFVLSGCALLKNNKSYTILDRNYSVNCSLTNCISDVYSDFPEKINYDSYFNRLDTLQKLLPSSANIHIKAYGLNVYPAAAIAAAQKTKSCTLYPLFKGSLNEHLRMVIAKKLDSPITDDPLKLYTLLQDPHSQNQMVHGYSLKYLKSIQDYDVSEMLATYKGKLVINYNESSELYDRDAHLQKKR